MVGCVALSILTTSSVNFTSASCFRILQLANLLMTNVTEDGEPCHCFLTASYIKLLMYYFSKPNSPG